MLINYKEKDISTVGKFHRYHLPKWLNLASPVGQMPLSESAGHSRKCATSPVKYMCPKYLTCLQACGTNQTNPDCRSSFKTAGMGF